MRRIVQSTGFALALVWASPYTLFGLAVGTLGLLTGGTAKRRGRTIEFYGGAVKWLILGLPHGQFTLAMTLGHTILGQTAASLDIAREHEWIHVRQYERWGIFFGPAYLLASLVIWLRGGRAYRDNLFEREAYDATGDW
jgi:hypothetical protein